MKKSRRFLYGFWNLLTKRALEYIRVKKINRRIKKILRDTK